MLARPGPRFALEAGFLILVAALAGLGDLSWRLIVLVMGVAWVLVAIHEYARWREGPRPARPARPAAPQAPAPVASTLTDELTRVIRSEEPEQSGHVPWPQLEQPPEARERRRSGGAPL